MNLHHLGKFDKIGLMKPVLFIDFDGTLCHDRFWRSLPMEDYNSIQHLLFNKDKSVIEKWMVGDTNSEEINRFIAEHLKRPFHDIWESFVSDCKTMYVDRAVLQKIDGLRTKYTVVLLTVNMDCFSRLTVPELGLENYFDDISNSYYTRKTKTYKEGEIYKELASKHGASLVNCFTIDDSISACDIFEKLGGKSYLVTPESNISAHLSKL